MAIDEHPAIAQRPSRAGAAATNRTLPAPSARVRRWQRLFAVLLSVTDFVVITAAVFGTQVLRFGTNAPPVSIPGLPRVDQVLTYTFVSILLVLGWALFLRLFGTRDPKIIGTGLIEYKRVINATFAFFGLFAIASFVLQAMIGRAYLLIALPLGLVLLLLSRWMWRKWLISRRRRGRLMTHALLVGDRASSAHVAEQIRRDPACGIKIVGALTERGSTDNELEGGIPVLGAWHNVLRHVDLARADTVILTGNHTLAPKQLRELGWGLEDRKANLIVAPALTDVAGPRIHSTPVAGLPLIHVDYPELSGIDRFLKRAFDVLGALGLIILSAPIMLIVAVAVKATSSGPVLYGHERIGRYGAPFKMWKFRSMVDGANDQLQSLGLLNG